ncbi:MAG: ABC transporter permease [Verrucomicrobiota bacterium]
MMTRAFFIQLKREFGSILLSPIAYVIFVCLAFVNGISFMQCVHLAAQGVRDYTVMQIFFYIVYFWFVLLVLMPALTMRLFSEEYKSGTIETLLTAPLSEWDVVLSKFFAAVGFYMILWVPTLLYLAVFQILTRHQLPIVWEPILLSYFIVLLIGMFWISIGMFTSSLTKNQIVAAILSFTIIATLFFVGFLSYIIKDSSVKEILSYIFAYDHTQQYSQGYFDSRPLIFYLSGTALFLALTHHVLTSRKHND